MTPADLDLDHLEALDREATPAPWHILDIPWRDPRVPGEVVAATLLQMPPLAMHDSDLWDENARLIAATRNALPHLIAEARAAEGVRDALGHGADEEAWPPGMTLGEAVAELRRRIALLRVSGEGFRAAEITGQATLRAAGAALAYRDAGDAILEVLDADEARLSEMEAAMQAVDGVER